MSSRSRVFPALVAIATGVVSGVYIFQPLILEERKRQLADSTLNHPTPTAIDAPPNTTATVNPSSAPASKSP